jgi:hypothetical protein
MPACAVLHVTRDAASGSGGQARTSRGISRVDAAHGTERRAGCGGGELRGRCRDTSPRAVPSAPQGSIDTTLAPALPGSVRRSSVVGPPSSQPVSPEWLRLPGSYPDGAGPPWPSEHQQLHERISMSDAATMPPADDAQARAARRSARRLQPALEAHARTQSLRSATHAWAGPGPRCRERPLHRRARGRV